MELMNNRRIINSNDCVFSIKYISGILTHASDDLQPLQE